MACRRVWQHASCGLRSGPGSGAGSVIQWVLSEDGGRTWTEPDAAPINACAGGPVADAARSSDPWATFGPDGRAYIFAIAWTPAPDDGPDLVSALVVVASPDGGRMWEPPVAAAVAPTRSIAHDNLAITADPTRPGTVYAATTREEMEDGEYYGRLGFTTSSDGGRSWSAMPTDACPARERLRGRRITGTRTAVRSHCTTSSVALATIRHSRSSSGIR